MSETLRNNPDGLKQNQKAELLTSLTERIGVTFTSEEMAKEYFTMALGSDFHEEWRKTRFHTRNEKDFKVGETIIKVDGIDYVFKGVVDGKGMFEITDQGKKSSGFAMSAIRYDYAPRMKKSKDPEWTQAHGTDDVDIANTKFEDLPKNLQASNTDAAKFLIDLMFDLVISGEEITDEMVEELADKVHEDRMERNSWEKDARPQLFVPYKELPEDEKDKDRAQVRQVIVKIRYDK